MFGTVSKYDRIRGFGFIVPDDDNEPDYFTCAKFIDPTRRLRFLVSGMRVEFEPVEETAGPTAHNVRVLPTTIAIQRSAPGVQR